MGVNSRAVTGYPAPIGYPAQPRPPQPLSLCRRLFPIFFVIVALTFLIVFLVAEFSSHIPVFHVSSLSLSNFDTSTSPYLITGNWDVQLIAKNPGKVPLHYDKVNATLLYKKEIISQATFPRFYVGKKNETVVFGRLGTVGTNVAGWVVDDISKNRNNASVGFNVKLDARVRFKAYGSIWMTRSPVRVYCEGLELGLTAATGNASLVATLEKECVIRSW